MDAHAHGHGGKDHVPHVLPFSTYVKTLATLLFLTIITVAASYVDFGGANLWIAMGIATVKASVVALIFMHLFWDHKFHSIVLVMSLIFLGVFISFTMFDTESRGRGGETINGDRPADIKAPFAGSRRDAEMKARWTKEEPKDEKAEPAGTAAPHH
jgi:cytochrome c oxidase subunit IV